MTSATLQNDAVSSRVPDRLEDLRHLIGDTPLIAIEYELRRRPQTVYVKCENLSFTGSIKDRMAWSILQSAYAAGTLRQGDEIVEATSGNTGIAFAAIGRALGHPVTIFMPDWMSQERVKIIGSFGATIHPITRAQGGFLGSIQCCEDLAQCRGNVFLPRQFSNAANISAHYFGTGPELLHQLRMQALEPDAFVAGVGTGGTVMGVGAYLKQAVPNVKLYAVEPAESPTLSTGHKVGSHRIQGISDDFIPPVLNLQLIDSVLPISDGDSIIMAQRLASELGLGVGISSGCNFLAAVTAKTLLGDAAVITTVFCDDNKKYLSTGLLSDEPAKAEYLSSSIQLNRVRSFPRAGLNARE